MDNVSLNFCYELIFFLNLINPL